MELGRLDIDAALREGGRTQTGGRRHRRFLSALIVMESALSVVLLVGTGLMLRSFARIAEVNPGFHAEHVLAAEIPSPWPANFGDTRERTAAKTHYFDRLMQTLKRIPGVDAAGLITGLPMGTVATQTLIRPEGREPGPGVDLRVGYSSISPGYFRAMGIAIAKGRSFEASDTAEKPMVAIVNEAMARHLWPNEDPIGKRFTFNPNGSGPWASVVGVAANVRSSSLTAEPESQLYMSYKQSLLAPQNAAVVIRTLLDPASQAVALRAAVHQADPGQPVSEVRPMTQVVADSVGQPRLYTVLLGIFGALALGLAAAGIFSVLSWIVNQKMHEIAIRMALGAAPRRVVSSVMRGALVETLVGCAAGLGGAAALTGILRTQLYHVGETDPISFVGAPLVLLAAAAGAAYLPARRATRVNPACALNKVL
jgi:putative ABC transport system permease protein